MAHFICPACGSKYFSPSTTGQKHVFQILDERTLHFVHSEGPSEEVNDKQIIRCGSCSWKGYLAETVECHVD